MDAWKPILDQASLPPLDAEESELLDFKREPWESNDSGYNELARDVAQFANHLGGSIIVGAVEDGQDRLAEYVSVPDAAAVAARVADVCHSALSPRPDVRPVVITTGAIQVVSVNVLPHDGVVANRLKGTDRWEFKRRFGKTKRSLTFEEVEEMWTEGRRGRVLLSKVPQGSSIYIDAIENNVHLQGPFQIRLQDDYFIVAFDRPGHNVSLPYECVRAVWPRAGGGWSIALAVEFSRFTSSSPIRAKYLPG